MKLIELAAERDKAQAKSLGSVSAASAALQAAVAKTQLKEASQRIAGECAATVTLVSESRSTSEDVYAFHFADLDPRTIDVRARNGYVALDIGTRDRESYVKHTEDGELDGFDKSVELRFSNGLAVREALAAVEYLAENCPAAVTKPSLAAAVQSASIPRFEEGEDEQVFAKSESGDCSYVVTLTERTGSKIRETQTTFSLRDLDPRASALKTSSSEVYVTYGTRHNERVIDVVKDGGDQRYEDALSIRFKDVQSAREFMAAFEDAIKACE